MINENLTHRLNIPVSKETWEAVNNLAYAAKVKPTTFTRSIIDMFLSEIKQTEETTNDQPADSTGQ